MVEHFLLQDSHLQCLKKFFLKAQDLYNNEIENKHSQVERVHSDQLQQVKLASKGVPPYYNFSLSNNQLWFFLL